jgi:PIN domain nuclease of toxin-antitoxin system
VDLLLDTHVLLRWDSDSPKLGASARELISLSGSRVFVSAASVWEIGIKRRTGKLRFQGSAVEAIQQNGFIALPILGADAAAASELDWAHNDPFDRLLVAQARLHGLVLVTADAVIGGFAHVVRQLAN